MLADLLDRIDELKAELDDVRPLSTEDEQRLRAKFTEEEIDAKVTIITDEIYRHIEQFAEQST